MCVDCTHIPRIRFKGILEERIMCGDGKESFRVPAVMYSDDLISYIASVCNGCLEYSKCEIAKSFAVLDSCENFKRGEMQLIPNSRQSSVFVFPSTSLYRSISQEIPGEKLHFIKPMEAGGKIS